MKLWNSTDIDWDEYAGAVAFVSDTAYGSGWNGDTTTAPSKNAVYDKIEGLSGTYAPLDYAGKLLAVVKNTAGGNKSTSSSTQSDVDATNAAVTFTAPGSGKVLVRVTAVVNLPASNVNAFFGLREGTTDLVNGTTGTQALQSQSSDTGGDVVVAWCAYLTGVSAGSHTYKLGFAVNGGVTFTVRSAAVSPMTIEVWAAP